jgi:hypothetical protein
VIEFLKLISDFLIKVIPAIPEKKKNKKFHELGAGLFLLYVKINECLMAGSALIRSLEVYRDRMGDHLRNGSDPYALTAGHWVAYNAQVQRNRLAEIGNLILSLSTELQIIDGESFRALLPLLTGKFNALDSLLAVMDRGIPLTFYESLEQHRSSLELNAYSKNHGNARQNLRSDLGAGTVLTDREWGEDAYRQVSHYLEVRQPRKQLKEIERVLDVMHASIEAEFTMKDILLTVGDSKFKSNYDGEYFWGR